MTGRNVVHAGRTLCNRLPEGSTRLGQVLRGIRPRESLTPSLIVEKLCNGNLQAPRNGDNLVIHEVSGLVFNPGNGAAIHQDSPGRELRRACGRTGGLLPRCARPGPWCIERWNVRRSGRLGHTDIGPD